MNTLIPTTHVIGAFGRPVQGQYPAEGEIVDLIETIQTWGLIICILAIIISATLWAFGAQSQNAAQASQGKMGVIVAVAASAVIFASEGLVNWAVNLG